jgi:P27 family predicted phage terminase small subunit
MSKEARRHWRRLAVILSPLGLLSAGDSDAFAMLCEALAMVDLCRIKLRELGGPVVAHKGKPMLNPYLSVLRSAEATCTKLFGEFGLSPSSRTRIWASANPPTPTKHVAPDVAESYFQDQPGDDPDSVQ